MPLSFGIPFGLLIVLVGAILFFATRHKNIARLMIGFGGAIAIFSVIVIVLAVNSNM